MSRAKPASICTGKISKEEKEKRTQLEEEMKGDSRPPKTAPAFLCLDNEGEKFYRMMIRNLPEDLLNYLDVFSLGICCDALSKMEQCKRILQQEGLLVEYTNKAGASNIIEHKAINIYQKYVGIFNTYGSKLGLSPADRAKIVSLAHKATEVDEFEQLLNS